MKRALIAAAVAASFFATNLLAAETAGPLAPAKPAGVKKAQDFDWSTWGVIGGVALGGLLIGLTAGQSSGVPITPTTSPATTST